MVESLLPSDYPIFLSSMKERVQQAQLQAVLSVNRELILLYWHIGREIIKQQEQLGWGTGVIERLSRDLHAAFPEMKGFSPRNLGYMKLLAQTYPDEVILQVALAKLPWYHHITLLDKVKDEHQRLWYIQQSIEHSWSRNVLVHQIETNLYDRKGKAITNFSSTLPALHSDLAQDALKDPYVFDFITTNGEETKERDLQSALISHIRRFLLELGVGFTFVGSNYHVQVGDNDFYIDLLFYHIRLHRYVIIELKTGEFKAEYAGKMNLYLAAVNRQIKEPEDNPSIGIILCRSRDKATAEYALSDMQKPIGVASYTTGLPESLRDKLPDIKELEESLEEIRTDADKQY
jgi:predicted nuclease of restriction endonuclease-like (RecB) superfamily